MCYDSFLHTTIPGGGRLILRGNARGSSFPKPIEGILEATAYGQELRERNGLRLKRSGMLEYYRGWGLDN